MIDLARGLASQAPQRGRRESRAEERSAHVAERGDWGARLDEGSRHLVGDAEIPHRRRPPLRAEVEARSVGAQRRACHLGARLAHHLHDRLHAAARCKGHELHVAAVLGHQDVASWRREDIVGTRELGCARGGEVVEDADRLRGRVERPNPVVGGGGEVDGAGLEPAALAAGEGGGGSDLVAGGAICEREVLRVLREEGRILGVLGQTRLRRGRSEPRRIDRAAPRRARAGQRVPGERPHLPGLDRALTQRVEDLGRLQDPGAEVGIAVGCEAVEASVERVFGEIHLVM